MITVEGLIIKPTIEALQEGEGFNVKLITDWFPNRQGAHLSTETRSAISEARSQDIIGYRFNGHESTFADAMTRVDNEISAFKTEIVQFINDWNEGVYES